MSFKPIDPKRDEIRRYLERGSVLDSLTKIFIRVIKERPENPMEYIRNNIGVVRHQHDKYERLQQDLQLANEEIQRLRGIINGINPEMLQGHQPVAPGEGSSDISEAILESTPVQEEQQQQQPQPEERGEAKQAAGESAADVAELTAAVDATHIEEKPVATPNENAAVAPTVHPTTSPSVQAEASSPAE